jgi:S-DNA-T family DNA segregation ATPase FtsK/SpoIIIE
VSDRSDTAFHRTPRDYPPPVPDEQLVVQAPPQTSSTPGSSLLFALFPILGGLGMVGFAFVYKNKLFLIIAGGMVLVTVLFGLLMWWSQRRQGRLSARRQRRRYRDYLAAQDRRLAEIAALQRASGERLAPDLQRQWGRVLRTEHLWERRPADPDFLTVRVGRGPVAHAARPRLDSGYNALAEHEPRLLEEAEALVARWTTLEQEPVTLDLADAGVLSVVGAQAPARALVRAALCHLAVACAPTDLRLAVAHHEDAAAEWDWVKWLPHARTAARGAAGEAVTAPRPALATGVDDLAGLLDELVAPRLDQLRTLAAARPGAEAEPIEAPQLVLVVDGYAPGDPRARLPLLREVLARGRDLRVSVVCLVGRPEDEPSDARARIRVPDRGHATLEATGPGGERTERIDLDDASLGIAEALARALAPIRLEEHSAAGGPRAGAGLLELLGLPSVDAVDPATDWRHRPRSLALRTTIGVSDAGAPLELDLKQAAEGGMGPHGLIIGATGSGKSELLRTLVAGLALAHPPDELAFVFVDFKGGAALAELERLPHTAGMITNLQSDMRLIDRMHDALYAEQERRQQLLRDAGNIDDAHAYRRRRAEDPSLPPLPDLLVIIDEFGELLAAKPDFIDLFVAIGRVGRSLGIHLLFSSQRFEEGRLRGLESHLRYRICLRTYSPMESKAVLGTPDAYVLPPDPGLGYLKVDTSVYERFKTALVSRPVAAEVEVAPAVVRFGADAERVAVGGGQDDDAPDAVTEMRLLVDRLRAAGGEPVHQVWLEPLDREVALDAVAPVPEPEGALTATIGRIDVPKAQRQEPLVLDFSGSGGHLAVVGAPRSGKSTVLRTLALALAREHTPAEVQLLGIDLGGGALRALETLPHCTAVAGKVDRELVRQVVRHLRTTIQEREAAFRRLGIDAMGEARGRRGADPDAPAIPDLFLLVDGWAQLKRDFVDLDQEIEELASAGLAFGVHVVIAAARWAEMRPSLSDNLGGRLELRLNEPLESEVDRRAAETLPVDAPGRGLVAGPAEIQVALPRLDGVASADGLGEAVAAAAAAIPGAPAPRVRVLPLQVRAADLPVDPDRPGIAIGVEELRLEPVHLDLSGADPHFLVLGDGESGRTNLLRAFVRGLAEREAPERAQVVIVDPRRTLADLAALPHVAAYAPNARLAADAAARIAATVRERLPDEHASPGDLVEPPRWEGPRLYLVVDDYDLLAGPEGNPLAPLIGAVAHGRDAGLHVVLARRVAGTARAAFEPFFQKLVELRSPGIILSGEHAEGPLLDNHRASAQPPGRGLLVRRGRQAVLVQTVVAQRGDDRAAPADASLAGRTP